MSAPSHSGSIPRPESGSPNCEVNEGSEPPPPAVSQDMKVETTAQKPEVKTAKFYLPSPSTHDIEPNSCSPVYLIRFLLYNSISFLIATAGVFSFIAVSTIIEI